MGVIDNWRVQRNNAYLVYVAMVGSSNALPITEVLSLPYDEEYIKSERKEEQQLKDDALMQHIRDSGYFTDQSWLKAV